MAIQTYRFLNEDGLNKLLSELRTTLDSLYAPKEGAETQTGAQAKADAALASAKQYADTHINDKNNPHAVTAEQVGARPNTWMPTATEVGADPAGTAQTKVDELANNAVAQNTANIEKLNGDANTAGSVAKAIADAISASEGTTQDSIDAVQDAVDALGEKVGDLEGLDTTAKSDLVDAINEVRNAVSAGGVAAAITMDTTTTTDGMLKSYTIKQGENTIGVIDIPKDMVGVSGEVVVDPDGKEAGTYIKMSVANGEPFYINATAFIDNYKAKASAAQVQIAVDAATREISATIVAGSIGTAELADAGVTTAKIADANVTKAKLSTAVQASLDKADAAAPQTALDAEVERATKAEAQALTDAKAYTDTHSNNKNNPHEVTAAQVGADVAGSAAQALTDAKAYADQKVAGVTVDTLGAETPTGAQAKADAALASAKQYADTIHELIILADVTTNAKYKLYVDNGTLVIEEYTAQA